MYKGIDKATGETVAIKHVSASSRSIQDTDRRSMPTRLESGTDITSFVD